MADDQTNGGLGIEAFVPFFKAFCNGTRAGIVEQLLGGERCVCELTTDVDASQPLVSHHLAVLRDTGFVRMREEGPRTYALGERGLPSAFQDDPESCGARSQMVDGLVDLVELEGLADGCDVVTGCEVQHGQRGGRAARG